MAITVEKGVVAETTITPSIVEFTLNGITVEVSDITPVVQLTGTTEIDILRSNQALYF